MTPSPQSVGMSQVVISDPRPALLPPPFPSESIAGGPATSVGSRLRGCALRVAQFGIGLVMAQSVVGAVILLGWTSRFMRRSGTRMWARQAGEAGGRMLESVCDWPGWFLSSDPARDAAPGVRGRLAHLLGSLGLNLKLGLRMLGNTWVLTLPGTALMQLSWYDGWNNSFNKGYEQAAVGPGLGILGLVLFMAAMVYVPMAQARQAMCGDWRRFYDFALVGRLIRREWLGSALLALGFATLAVPVTLLRTAPAFFTQINPALAHHSAEQAALLLDRYFLASALVFLPIFVGLHRFAARLYAGALLRALRGGAVFGADLGDPEMRMLNDLGLTGPKAGSAVPSWRRIAAWLGTRIGQACAAGFILLCWFVVVAQVYVGEFFLYHPGWGFLNHPLIQLPVLR